MAQTILMCRIEAHLDDLQACFRRTFFVEGALKLCFN